MSTTEESAEPNNPASDIEPSDSEKATRVYKKKAPAFAFSSGGGVVFSAAEVASIVSGYSDTGEVLICGLLAYMKKFKEAIPSTTRNELEEALLQYNELYDVTSFGYKTFQLVFLHGGHLRLFEMKVVEEKKDTNFNHLIQPVEENKTVGAFADRFGYELQKQKKRPALEEPTYPTGRTYLPPVYDAHGRHVMGGVPWKKY